MKEPLHQSEETLMSSSHCSGREIFSATLQNIFYSTLASYSSTVFSMAGNNFMAFKRHGTERFSKHTPSFVWFHKEFSPIILKALATVSPSSEQSFVMADYGSADGLTSRHVVRECISYIRETYGTSLSITVIYEDQPINDFTPIFHLNAGLIGGETSFTEEFKNVYILASGTSFYQQCLPPNSLDFLISSFAQHWLSKPPGIMENTIFSNLATGPERRAYEEQAASDWENFLLLRAAELKDGGCMVIIKPREGETKESLSPLAEVGRDLLDDGLITKDEFRCTNFPFHKSSIKSMEMPFLDKNSSVRKAGLVLTSKITREFLLTPGSSEAENLYSNETKKQPNLSVKELKAWSENVFWCSLGNDRTGEEKEAILNEYYSRLAQKLCGADETGGMHFAAMCLVIRKCREMR